MDIAKFHAEEWRRCILSASGDDNVAQQAVALAALNGLFDLHREFGELQRLAADRRVSSEAIGIRVRNHSAGQGASE